MNVPLRDGMSVDIRERINHKVDKDIKTARLVSMKDDTIAFDWADVLVRAFVRDWSVRDPDGNPIPWTDPDALDRCPDDIADTLFDEARRAWTEATQPNEQYARLIGRLVMGQKVSESEVESLSDPETFRDAIILATEGRWSPQDLDDTDAMLLALVTRIKNARKG